MTFLDTILYLCVQVASQCVTVWACGRVLSCKHIHPAVRNFLACFMVIRHMVAFDMWMCCFVWCVYIMWMGCFVQCVYSGILWSFAKVNARSIV